MQHGERFNTLTHLGGLALAVAGAAALVTKAIQGGDGWKLWGASVFAASMVVLYAASSLYHGTHGPSKQRWAKVDHCAIYVLIAGTYTPFTLVTLRGVWGWSLLGAVWFLALVGIAKELLLGRDRLPSVPLYVTMGWLVVVAAEPLMRHLSLPGAMWLLAGGVLYTVGVLFYAKSNVWRHSHGIWHLFVLAGTSSHFVTVFRYVT